MKNSRILLPALLLASLASVASAQPVLPVITNVVSTQRVGTFFVDVTYDLIAPESPGGVYLLAEASVDNGTTYNIPMLSVTGDAGLVTPGTGKKLAWNAFKDRGPNNFTTNARVRLVADDWSAVFGTTNAGNFTASTPPATNLVWIPSGVFNMEGTYVYLTKGCWMGKYPVTQAEYQNVMSSNPSYFGGNPNRPVEQVTWYDAVNYCQTLTVSAQAAGLITTNWVYRLPTEAEWEYACRAGTTTTYYFGEDAYGTRLPSYAWYSVNSGGQTHDVGGRAPNRWGLYDMAGNVWEWCQDWYSGLPGGNVLDPQGPSSGSDRVVRGGGWNSVAGYCASACRAYYNPPSSRYSHYGFRVVLAPVQ